MVSIKDEIIQELKEEVELYKYNIRKKKSKNLDYSNDLINLSNSRKELLELVRVTNGSSKPMSR